MTDRRGIGTFVSDDVELTTSSLDLFTPLVPENVLKNGFTVEINPTSALTDTGPYEFIIPRDPDHYIYLPLTRLSGHLTFTKPDGTALAATVTCSMCNMVSQSIFRQVELELEGVQVNDLSSATYALKAFIETILTYGAEPKVTHLRLANFLQDDAEDYETLTHKVLKSRTDRMINTKGIYFNQIIHSDFLQSERLLIPNVGMNFKFIRNFDSYSLIGSGAEIPVKIHVKNLRLSVHKIAIASDFDKAIEANLLKEPALYPITQSKIRTFLLHSGTKTTTLQNVITGNLPQGLVICFLERGAYTGELANNPFVFKNFKLNSLNLKINGIPFHNRPFQPDYEIGDFYREYANLFNHTGVLHGNNTFTITKEEFVSNCNFYPFDFSPDLCNSFHQHATKDGNIEVEIGFKTELENNIYMLVYASFKQTIVIDSKRTVTLVE